MKIKPRIVFSKLHIKYFLCFEEIVFDFLKHSGLNLITGINNDIPNVKNGSGKSSFLSSLYYSIYGKTPKNINNQNLVNRQFKNNTSYLKVEFFVDNKKYEVISILDGKVCRCQLFENGEDITKSTVKDTRNYIEKEILKIPSNTFLRTILLSKESSDNFFTLSKNEKRLFKEELFDLTIFGDMYNTIHKDTLSLTNEINGNQEKLKLIERNIEQLTNSLNNFNSNSKLKKDELKERSKKLIDDLLKLLSVNNLDEFKEKRNNLNNEKTDLQNQINELEKTIRNNSLLIERSISKKENLIQNGKKYEKILNVVCDDCEKELKNEFNLKNDEESIKKLEDVISSLTEENNNLEINLNKLNTSFSDICAVINEILEIEDELKNIKKEFNILTQNETTPFNELLEHAKTDKDGCLELIQKQLLDKLYLNKLEEIVSEDGIKKYIIKDVINILNDRLKYYLNKLGANYICQCNSDFDFEFITSTGPTEYNSFSSGEVTRINIAALFAFKDLLTIQSMAMTNLYFLDEYFDSALDEFSINALLKLLKEELEQRDETIYIISHRQEILNETTQDTSFSNVIVFEKTNGISQITKDDQSSNV